MIIRLKRFGFTQALEFLDKSTQNYIYKCDIYNTIHLYSDKEKVGYITTDTFQKLQPALTCTLITAVSEFYKSSHALHVEQLEKQSETSNLLKTASLLKYTGTPTSKSQFDFKEIAESMQENASIMDKVKPLDFVDTNVMIPEDTRIIYGNDLVQNNEGQ
jgi:hypothetical protein